MANLMDFAYTEWRNRKRRGENSDTTISTGGYGEVRLDKDSLPLLKIALIGHHLNERGSFPKATRNIYKPSHHRFER